MSESYAAVADAVPRARERFGAFAAAGGIGDGGLHAVRLAVSEAVTNVVRHAYRGVPGEVHVAAVWLPGELVVLVTDEGCGYQTPPVDPGFGWGLALIADSTDEFVISERADGGTEIRMRFLTAQEDQKEDQEGRSVTRVG